MNYFSMDYLLDKMPRNLRTNKMHGTEEVIGLVSDWITTVGQTVIAEKGIHDYFYNLINVVVTEPQPPDPQIASAAEDHDHDGSPDEQDG